MSATLTPREVAELAGAPKRLVEKAIEEKALTVYAGALPGVHSRSAAGRRLLGPESVAYVAVIRHLGSAVALSKASKRGLARALSGQDFSTMKTAKIEVAPALVADVGRLAGAELDRADRYLAARDAWIDRVEGIKGGLPTIRGTRITAHSVDARLKAGDTLDSIAAENSDIPHEAFEAAALFARAHPLTGRPTGLPRRSA